MSEIARGTIYWLLACIMLLAFAEHILYYVTCFEREKAGPFLTPFLFQMVWLPILSVLKAWLAKQHLRAGWKSAATNGD